MHTIPGYEGRYAVRDDGVIFSLLTDKPISVSTARTGYCQVCLYDAIGNKRTHRVARIVFSAVYGAIPPAMEVDHKDRNKANNHPNNLRLATAQQNRLNRLLKNRTGFRGVSHDTKRRLAKPFLATIRTPTGKKNLGWFATAKEAAMAFDVAAKAMHGEWAQLNFK